MVEQYDLNGNFIRCWNSADQASMTLGILPSRLLQCLEGRLNQTNGYIWTYKIKDGKFEW